MLCIVMDEFGFMTAKRDGVSGRERDDAVRGAR